MAKKRFADTSTETLPLSDGDWVRVKKELGVEDARALQGAGFRTWEAGDGQQQRAVVHVDWAATALQRIRTWVVEWSFRDERGVPVPLTRETVAALTTDTFQEIDAALDKHIKEIEDQKKAQAGGSESNPTS